MSGGVSARIGTSAFHVAFVLRHGRVFYDTARAKKHLVSNGGTRVARKVSIIEWAAHNRLARASIFFVIWYL